MKLRYVATLFTLAALVMSSPAQADTGFACTIDGLQEFPANASPGTGSGIFVLNNAGTSLSYNISYSGLTANRTASHIHGPAAPGANAGVLFGLAGAGPNADTFIGSWNTISAAQVGQLVAGLMYVNVHSQNFTPGEIRGQILGAPTSSRSTTWGRLKKLYSK